MSIFNELLQKINEVPNGFIKNLKDDLQSALDSIDKFGDDFLAAKTKTRDASQKNKNATALQSIHEDEDEPAKGQPEQEKRRPSRASKSSLDNKNADDAPKRRSKKRSKDEVDEMSSPEQDKRPKRNASVKAQGVISKQVNVNLSSKLRREASSEDARGSKRRGRKDDGSDKENSEPVVQVKLEKISLPPEPMDTESLPLDINVKLEPNKDDIAMPPPAAPIPKPRGRAAKNKEKEREAEDSVREEESNRRRNTRGKKTDTAAPPVPAPRPTRASSRASSRANSTVSEPVEVATQESRPKRTRAKKKVSETTDSEKETTTQDNATPEKPRPKRTRRGQKAAEKEPKEKETENLPQEEAKPVEIISPKEERISEPPTNISSPILTKKNNTKSKDTKSKLQRDSTDGAIQVNGVGNSNLDQTHTISTDMNVTVNICNGEMDKTVILPNGKYDHGKTTNMNETVVIDSSTASRETMVIEKHPEIMNATVVIEKIQEPQVTNVTDDNSLLTDDNSDHEPATPPRQDLPSSQPKYPPPLALISPPDALPPRRAAPRNFFDLDEPAENQTPPDKISKAVLSAETLTKMNSLIFNGKTQPQISSSASKPRANIVTSVKSLIPSSTSKLSSLSKHMEEHDNMKKEREDARKKKEAMLLAKKEQQKRKREEKMAAAAAAREQAERERQLAIEAAARERQEKQAQADHGKMERMKEAERKKLELARKVAEMEERRKAEERARQRRLEDEQKRAEDAKKRQMEEQEAVKKEAAQMAKEIEKRHKEYLEKQKMKQRMEANKMHTPLKHTSFSSQSTLEPVYMADGFEQLNSDEEQDEPSVRRPVPAWSSSKGRYQQLTIQSQLRQAHVARWFCVRAQTPDLRTMFPDIDRRALKRTSSAVWRTPR
ncbi:hypothetical protein JYU34_020261 [Plutella xylostella]|uniref:Uncharacterized protein n=1 Tax=Plutella xylostella TaxID=51655 RepID=A0ABQ7PUD2_PLUXY|nr:hypothetical protein JYU34_020261 [Plutella xylostella]